jgi:hypothetical protein
MVLAFGFDHIIIQTNNAPIPGPVKPLTPLSRYSLRILAKPAITQWRPAGCGGVNAGRGR